MKMGDRVVVRLHPHNPATFAALVDRHGTLNKIFDINEVDSALVTLDPVGEDDMFEEVILPTIMLRKE
jgi:hypothetical protein